MTLRTEPLAHLPALVGLALAALSLPARADAQLVSLCAGGSLPGQVPARRDCDQACHVGCNREKKAGSGRL
jgi:hypothetical protein